MGIFVERPASPALWNLCRRIQDNVAPGSPVQNLIRRDIRKIAVSDHTDMLLRGVDRYGVMRAPLAESTLANKKRGPGPSLIPRGMMSRFITHFEAVWESDIGQGVMFLVCRYRDILSKPSLGFRAKVKANPKHKGMDPHALDSEGKRLKHDGSPQPFVQYHMTGARKPGTSWVLPRRDTGGITPKGWAAIKARWATFPDDVRRMGGGRL